MQQLILWFNIIGFTILFASFGTTLVAYGQMKARWLPFYLVYLASYALFTLLNTYHFFSRVFLASIPALLDAISLAVTYFVAAMLLYMVPRFVFSLFSEKIIRKQKIFIYSMLTVCLCLMIISLIFPEWKLNRIGSIMMNGYLGMVTLYGVIRLQDVKDSIHFGVIVPFLYLSLIFYWIVVAESTFFPLFMNSEQESLLSLFTAGLICFIWGSVTLTYLMVKKRRPENPISVTLSTETAVRFGFTAREKEIINLLLYGNSNKEISEKFFISPRTVETHIYNIYRKCAVKNKLELARKISTGF